MAAGVFFLVRKKQMAAVMARPQMRMTIGTTMATVTRVSEAEEAEDSDPDELEQLRSSGQMSLIDFTGMPAATLSMS